MKWYRRFSESLRYAIERSGRMRALSVLRDMDPKILRDAGLSPELMKQGVGAWPWRAEAVNEAHMHARPVGSPGAVSEVDRNSVSQNLTERTPDRGNASEVPASVSDANTEIAA